jgi:hypothetical protein
VSAEDCENEQCFDKGRHFMSYYGLAKFFNEERAFLRDHVRTDEPPKGGTC